MESGEKGHTDRNQDKENERQTKIEKDFDCKFFHRNYPDAKDFDIFLEISKIRNYITQSNEVKKSEKENKIKEQQGKIKEQEEKLKEQEDKIKE